jgi:Flp pilus assembly protein TadD
VSALLASLLLWVSCATPPPAVPSTELQQLLDRAQQAERKRDYTAARALYEQGVKTAQDGRNRAYAEGELASALAFWGFYDEARAAYERAVQADPQLVRAWHDLGILRARSGDLVRAEQALQEAVKRAPREPRSRIALAALLMNRHKLDEAARHYRALLELDIPQRIRKAVKKALQLIAREQSS